MWTVETLEPMGPLKPVRAMPLCGSSGAPQPSGGPKSATRRTQSLGVDRNACSTAGAAPMAKPREPTARAWTAVVDIGATSLFPGLLTKLLEYFSANVHDLF